MEEVRPVPLRARFTRLQVAIVGLAVAFVVLAALVAGGRLTSVDRYALVHWMPRFDPTGATHSVPPVEGLVRPFPLAAPWWKKVLETTTYPASVLISLLVFGAAYVVLVRRGAKVAALFWVAAWFLANALEVVAKVAIVKPALYRSRDGIAYHVVPFDHSFPSGHTMRAVLVAGVVVFVWRRLVWPATVWVILVPVCLVVSAAHVPSDVVGGLVFGLLAVAVTWAFVAAARGRQS